MLHGAVMKEYLLWSIVEDDDQRGDDKDRHVHKEAGKEE